MELKLNVYNGNEVEKTYVSQSFRLMTGTCEDIIKIVDIEKLTGNLDDEKAMFEILKIVMRATLEFRPMMMQIFDGLTEDEYRRTDFGEVAKVVVQVLKHTFGQLLNATSKN